MTNFLKPTKRKVFISFFLILVWFILELLIRNAYHLLTSPNLSISVPGIWSINYWTFIPFLFIGIIIQAIYYYPLACFLSSLLEKRKKANSVPILKLTGQLIFFLGIFNPFTMRALFFTFVLIFQSV